MSNTAVILPSKQAKLVVQKRDIPTAGPHQMVVKNHAVATNPVDYLMQDTGYIVQSYPTVLGSDIAGTVESVGPDVTKFQKGDRVAGFACAIGTGNINEGAFQEYSILQDNATVKLPAKTSFEEGAVLPMAVATSGVGMFLGQGLPRPSSSSSSSSPQQAVFLVWGGASSVGSMAVQFARTLGFTVFATASPRHHAYIKKLGAAQVFDYNDPDVVRKIIDAAKSARSPIAYGFAAVSDGGAALAAAKVLSASAAESKTTAKLCLTLPWPEAEPKPEDVEISGIYAAVVGTDEKEFGAWLFGDFLAGKLESGEVVPSPAIEIVSGGLEAVPEALAQHKAGLSGKKLVIPLA